MDKKIEQSLIASISGFIIGNGHPLEASFHLNTQIDSFYTAIINVFKMNSNFEKMLDEMDAAFDQYSDFMPVRELFFDLLLINFLNRNSSNNGTESYLDSPEWLKIEEDTIDRGTELLNVFLYLRSCQDMDIIPDLDDYLTEFLLVDEDEFQDELEIYQDIISHQLLTESNYAEVAGVHEKLDEASMVKDIFYPFMSFFIEKRPSLSQIREFIQSAPFPSFDLAVLFSLLTYHGGLAKLPVKIRL